MPPSPVQTPLPPDASAAPDIAGLVAAHAAGVYRYLRGLTRDAELARDLTQETFLKLHGTNERITGEAGVAHYVFAVARNAALSHARRQRLERRHFVAADPWEIEAPAPVSAGHDPGQALAQRELARAIEDALATLPEPLRTVFLLSEIEGLSYAEIAQALRCPDGTVASRKHHAVQRLRRELRRHGHAL